MTSLKMGSMRAGAMMVLFLALGAGCDSLTTVDDAGSDAGANNDAGASDAGANDDAGASDDAGARDGGGEEDAQVAPTVPTVISSIPDDEALDVAINANVTAVFSEAMDTATLDGATFTLTSGTPPVAVDGRVISVANRAIFRPDARLASETTYTATITTGAESLAGVALAASHTWTFTTGTEAAPGLPVNLGTAENYVILAKSAVSTVPTSAITGDIGISPAAATAITGFSLTAESTGVASTSPQVTGRVFAADYAVPTPSNLTTAVSDMELAFTEAAGRAPDVTELGAGAIGGMTLDAGVYAWGTGVLIPTDITLTGSGTDVWIFQIAQNLTISSGVRIELSGEARPENVFWQVAGLVDVGTTAHLEGVVLSQTAITLHTGASVEGRLLAQTAVSIDGSTVVEPSE